jgi:CheY-like chemotaxis protein
MIQVCYYKGCGVVYGEKEPLAEKTVTHGLCPEHLRVSRREIEAEMERREHRARTFKVLIVEDSLLFQELFKESLRDRFPSLKIYQAMNGEEALEKTEAFLPDLIFMDIKLPGESGLDVTRRIKARYPDIIVIILAAHDLPEYRQLSRQCADYFFSKTLWASETIYTLVQSIL